MYSLFLKLLNMSITASWLIIAVIAFRVVLKKAPKYIRCLLWALVGLRLVLPFSIKSVLSLIPSSEPVSVDVIAPALNALSGMPPVVNTNTNTVIYGTPVIDTHNPASLLPDIGTVIGCIWIAGVAAMLIYALVSYLLLARKTREAVSYEKGIFLCDRIDSPFILGLFKPGIYLPCGIDDRDSEYVIAHERAHLRRRDHIWKPLGFAVLCVYWFNPVIWLAYILLCRDIELACDEKVIREMGMDIKKSYSEALINCSVSRRRISACPLAFGEVGVEKRVKTVLSYKKPAFWIIILAVVVSIVAAVCLLTDPEQKEDSVEQTGYSDIEGVSIRISDIEASAPSPYIEIEWKNESGKDIVYGESFYVYRDDNGNWVDCNEMSDVFSLIGYLLPDGKTVTKRYSLSYMQMEESGLYRFDTDCHIDGGEAQDYKLWIDFQLKNPIEGINIRQLDAVDWVCRPRSWDDFDMMYPPELPLYRVVNDKHFLIWEDGDWQACGDLAKTKLTKEKWDDEFEDGVWLDENSAEDFRLNNRNAWLIDRGESEFVHYFYMLLEQKDGRWYVAFGNFNREKGQRLFEVYEVEEKEPYTPEHSYDEMIPGESSESARFDVDGDGVEEICRRYYCPELENLSFILTVTEEGGPEVIYEYMSVFECTGADNIRFTEVDGRMCLVSMVEVDPDPPQTYKSEVIKTYWELDIDENRNLRLSTDGGKTVMKSYSANNVILNNYGDIIYAESNPTLSGDTQSYASDENFKVYYNDEYATERYDIDGDGAVEVCKLHSCPELEKFSFVFSAIEEGSPKSSYDYLTVFQCAGADEAVFTEMNGRLYVQTHDPAHPNFPYDDIYTLWEIDIDENGKLRLSFDNGKRVMTSYSENELTRDPDGNIILTKERSQ